MPEDETQEVPLPPGTIPDQESVITQEIPVVREAFPEIQLVSPVKVELPPLHLRNDPIMTMEAPVADDTPLYDQLNPPAPKPLPKRPRRRMKTGDKFLAGLCMATLGMGTVAYGMAFHGWGAGPMPEDEAKPQHSVVSEEPEVLPTTGPQPTSRPPVDKPVKVVSAPTSYSPTPEASVVVVSPTPTEEPSAPETAAETSEAPEPSPEPTKPSTPPPSPSPTPTRTTSPPSPSPSPSTTQTPVIPPVTLSASSTPEESASG